MIELALGLLLGFVLHIAAMSSYKRVLVMKSQDGSAECIDGKFYYIIPEEDETDDQSS